MPIRTLLATALLVSTAVLGSAGMAAADDEGNTPGSRGGTVADNMWGGGMPGDMLGGAGSGFGGADSGFGGAGNGVLGSTSFR
ncbi:hypothetical protein [Streptomyces sp. NPDC053427]|uniref:hypothetical protein n=1 Tax=Streptomyces sp. NPDC053427 TaxID=3365701 RepID=UPI0037D300F9